MDSGAAHRFPYSAAHGLIQWAGANWQTLQSNLGWDTPLEDMRAAHAYGWLYSQLTKGCDDEQKMKADVILGMPGARQALEAARAAKVGALGFEVVR